MQNEDISTAQYDLYKNGVHNQTSVASLQECPQLQGEFDSFGASHSV